MTIVTLRRAEPSDASALVTIRAEPSSSVYQPLQQVSVDHLAAMLAARAIGPLDRTFAGKAHWVVLVDSEIAGWVTLDVTSREHGIASIGYTVGERFRGQGIATAAARQLMSLAFNPFGVNIERLEAVAAVGNLGSRRVLAKVGFAEEGIARGLLVIAGVRVDHVRFGLLRNDR